MIGGFLEDRGNNSLKIWDIRLTLLTFKGGHREPDYECGHRISRSSKYSFTASTNPSP
ncbi:MAG: hypothetical protein PWR25_287 [Euryarchaeota archaeon]|jgi:hypothetical protein|nr:hypothetical protein [Euryarchaeota archaeon]MDN5339823.1 hypothetical protein [Euryarchaeota archaeon]